MRGIHVVEEGEERASSIDTRFMLKFLAKSAKLDVAQLDLMSQQRQQGNPRCSLSPSNSQIKHPSQVARSAKADELALAAFAFYYAGPLFPK